ncbi:TPA: bifunctional (p)ppGpp synthetase/guanosine-3',5'-bis(diphosphate) 3'-pyrophosphohydrolase [Candidatus Gracilibacteria bacterium]|nr:bifunctional (p)ppGpp synthetase/guanosine-3',5'-bis(diphosphate) 3'-pyrophosphohydrolase [Candidatus Gracilibacteria bacterium]
MTQNLKQNKCNVKSIYREIIEIMFAYNPNILREQKKYLRNVLEFLYKNHFKTFEARVVSVTFLLQIEPDMPTVLSCLLHEMDDEIIDDEILSELVCFDAVELIVQLKSISSINFQTPKNSEIIRRYLLSKITDIRVLYIRLAKRIGLLKMMKDNPCLHSEKQQQYALDSVYFIINPLLSHLGLYRLKTEAEDLYFELTNKKEYDFIKNATREKKYKNLLNLKFTEKIEVIKNNILKIFSDNNIIDVEVFGRKKGIYSIYKKIKTKDYHSIEDVHDIFALRIITYSVEDCYRALSILHTAYEHEEEHFSDYIATPKSNGYESIHTVILHNKNYVEVQIRTQEMDYNAEIGTASHWKYKGVHEIYKKTKKIDENQKNKEFSFFKNSFTKKIYASTPTGEIKELSVGATPIDFAYSIHSDIGDHCSGAIVNGDIVPLVYKIKEGDMIGILTDKNKFPKKEWLDIVISDSARKKIKSYLFSIGEKIVAKTDKTQDKKQIVEAEVTEKKGEKKIEHKSNKNTLIIGGEKNMIHHFAKCCNPEEKNNIVAYASTTRDFVIHHKNCLNVLRCDRKRLLKVERFG